MPPSTSRRIERFTAGLMRSTSVVARVDVDAGVAIGGAGRVSAIVGSPGGRRPGSGSRLWYFTQRPAAPNSLRSHAPNAPTSSAAAARHLARGACRRPVAAVAATGARADVALYQAAVPLKGTTAEDRSAALGRGAAVRSRCGPRAAARLPTTRPSPRADPARYVQQYSTTADRMLKVGFDGRPWSNCCSRRPAAVARGTAR